MRTLNTRSTSTIWCRRIRRFGSAISTAVLGVALLVSTARSEAGQPASISRCTASYLSSVAPRTVTIKTAAIATPTGGSPEHCRILASVPTGGNSIDFVVGFPTNWNQKFVWASQGGLAGQPMNLTTSFLQAGYATGVTDTGHQGSAEAVGGA